MSNYTAIISIPQFAVGITCDDYAVLEMVFLPAQAEKKAYGAGAVASLARETARQTQAWLKDPAFVFDLPLIDCGTPFRKKVWAEISRIPLGETRSYGQLAAAIGSAPRAVGGACGANPYPLIVPCHRVISASGGLGGFAHDDEQGFHLDVKRWLLAHECR